MSIKFIPKVGAAVVILAIVLIFLGVNYVPRIYALTSSQRNTSDSVILTRPNYVDELYPRAIAPQRSFTGSGYERYLQANALQGSSQQNSVDRVNLPRLNYVDELYPRAIAPQLSFAGTDPHDRTLRAIVPQLSFAGTDPHDRTLRAIVPQLSFAGTDPHDRTLRAIMPYISFTGADPR